MCAIIGYFGKKNPLPVLTEGLKNMEYRGYDSAGLALVRDKKITVYKTKGTIDNLTDQINEDNWEFGIGHTRWATHGEPEVRNAHPHLSNDEKIALAHNGIIENYQELREKLIQKGFVFKSDTDTEIIPNLIQRFYSGNFIDAVVKALNLVIGSYGIVVTHADHPDEIICARNGSPVLIGIDDGGLIIASDPVAIVPHTKKVIYLKDKEIAHIKDGVVSIINLESQYQPIDYEKLEMSPQEISRGGYDHYMLKEIFEQPESIRNAMRGRIINEKHSVHIDAITTYAYRLGQIRRIVITACGTSYHAGIIGKYYLEEMINIPVEVEYASEFRYRKRALGPDTLVIVISQSGETADTLEAMRSAKNQGALSFSICNVIGSSIARESHAGMYLYAGPEIGVASTKAFTSQVINLAIFSLALASLDLPLADELIARKDQLLLVPDLIKQTLEMFSLPEKISELAQKDHFIFLGRGYNMSVALEGALKLKEVSYIPATGLPLAEMKHGTIALIDENTPSVILCPKDYLYQKAYSNIEEIRSRSGRIIAVGTKGDENLPKIADHVFFVPEAPDWLYPVLTVIPLQLFAYHIAVARGLDVDRPRNLAKSVTVE